MNKRGALGEGIMMMYRLALVAFIAFTVLGVSSVFYAHYIDVRDAEAVVMTRSVVDCVAPGGVVDLSAFEEGVGVLSYCGFGSEEVERFYVGVVVDDGENVLELAQGDSGAMWVLDIYENIGKVGEDLRKYEPGYSKRDYVVLVLNGDVERAGKIEVEVLVSDEF